VGKSTIIVAIVVALGITVTLASFAVLMTVPPQPEYSPEEFRTQILFDRAEELLASGKQDKAIEAYQTVVNSYPGTEAAEQSLRKLAGIYSEKGDQEKARYYYNRLLKNFPNISDAEGVRSKLGEISTQMMRSPEITSGSIEYVVQSGDSLYAIAKKYNTTVNFIKKMNSLNTDVLQIGQKLKVNVSTFSILVDKSKNALILYKDGEPFKTYSVATGRDNSTPVGSFTITDKLVQPAWTKPDTGEIILPDSDQYELGARWLAISEKGYGIHGTHDDSYIGKQTTSGCVRMHNVDVIEVYDIVPVGTVVKIVDGS
jgi:lipoprotein-anchoring transpeptidase ErfK/SrfK